MSARALVAILSLLLLLLAGCAMTGERLQQEIERKLSKTDRYYAELEAEVYSGEGVQRYRIRQWVQNTKRWRVEVDADTAGQVFIFDGEQVYVCQPEVGDYYRLDTDTSGDVAHPFSLTAQMEMLSKIPSFNYEGSQEQSGRKYHVVSYAGNTQAELTRLWLDPGTLFPMISETRLDDELLTRISCLQLDFKPDFTDDLFIFEGIVEKELTAHCLITPVTLEQAKENWPGEVYQPEYLPAESFLFIISQGEEDGIQQLAFIYKGTQPFTLVQRARQALPPYRTRGTKEVKIGESTGYYHPNNSGELATLWWSSSSTSFILSGSIPLNEMIRIAESMQATR